MKKHLVLCFVFLLSHCSDQIGDREPTEVAPVTDEDDFESETNSFGAISRTGDFDSSYTTEESSSFGTTYAAQPSSPAASSRPSTPDMSFGIGISGDIPIAGAWNSDNLDEIGVYRPSVGMFFLDTSGDGFFDSSFGDSYTRFGPPNSIPVVGDWDGDGRDDIGVKSGARFYLDWNGNRTWDGSGPGKDVTFIFGEPSDLPLAGDWDGNGTDQVGLRRGNTYLFAQSEARDNSTRTVWKRMGGFGYPTDVAVIGDWNGDGRDSVGVYRPSDRRFYLDKNGDRRWTGMPTDTRSAPFLSGPQTPVAGDFRGNGRDQIGVYNNLRFYIDYNQNYQWDGTD